MNKVSRPSDAPPVAGRAGPCEGTGIITRYADVPIERLLDPKAPGYRELLRRCIVEGERHTGKQLP
ncbi:MAG: hypothetical protein WCS85_01715 [Candidatus Peribacteraceae bacterium]